MKVLICGGRDFSDRIFMFEKLDQFCNEIGKITAVIHGAARGADSLAGAWAEERGIPVEEFPADWQKYGRSAGPIRNAQMLEAGNPEAVISFAGGRGTADMVARAAKKGLKVHSY